MRGQAEAAHFGKRLPFRRLEAAEGERLLFNRDRLSERSDLQGRERDLRALQWSRKHLPESLSNLGAAVVPGRAHDDHVMSRIEDARRVAEEHGIDLAGVKPAGGRIEKSDVLALPRRWPM